MRKESETPELKKSLAQLREGIISLSAMLNKHQKGKVYFGINDEGKVCGQTVGERTIADITQTIRNHLKPLPPVLFKNGFIEAFGTGFDRAFSLCEKENVRYYYDNNDFGFTFCFMRKQNFLTSKVNEAGEHTGYFYISYYDKTLKAPQTYQFGKDLNVEELTLLQYDYLSSFDGLLEDRDETLLKTANIFETDEDEKLVSVGIRTTGRNNLADIFVYLLNDQSSHPEDGTLLSAFSAQPEYAGYHRVNLPESVHLEKGSKFSIVTTIREISEDGTLIYKYSVNMASNLEESQELGFPIYGKAVVNAGESFLYKNGSWSDWTEYRTTDEFKELYSENEYVYGEIDNFTIKAYLLPDETVEQDTVPAANTEIPVSQTETYAAQTVQTGVHNETGLWIIILFGSIICIYRLRKEA